MKQVWGSVVQSMEERAKQCRVAPVQWQYDVHGDYVTIATGALDTRKAHRRSSWDGAHIWDPVFKFKQDLSVALLGTGPVESASNVETSMTQIVQDFTIRAQVCTPTSCVPPCCHSALLICLVLCTDFIFHPL